MSTVEDDVELRDLVAQTLEKNGCLGKLRAELRASIFLALDEDVKLNKQQPLQNLRIQSYLETPEGRAMFGLVREFLDFFNLQFTISVYESESYFESIGQYEGRQKIAKDLGLDTIEEPTVPLLQQLLKIAQAKSKILDINLNVNSNINGSYVDESLNVDSSYKKTETYNTLSKTGSNNDSMRIENDPNNESEPFPIPIENTPYLNNTFDLKSSTVNLSHFSKIGTEYHHKNVLKDAILNEDTVENTSTIKEDSQTLNTSKYSLNNGSKPGNVLNEKSSNFKGDLMNPIISANYDKPLSVENECNSEINKKVVKEDDTYEDTSSIAEDSEGVVNTNSSNTTEKSVNEVPLLSPPVINSFKANEIVLHSQTNQSLKTDPEKPKLSPQRPKTSLSSLTDLPPLPINKSRVSNDILPSLYSKEFKNRSNLKELDKMFDMDVDYEEDFLYNSNQLSLNAPPLNLASGKNLLDEPGIVNKMDSEKLNILNRTEIKSTSKIVSEVDKSAFKPTVPKTCSNLLKTGEQSTNGSSEHSLSD